jgi:hypothetical protein
MYDAHTRNPDAASAAVANHDPWWHYVTTCATALQCGYQPPSIGVAGPVLVPGETAILCAPAHYSRLQSGTGDYDQSNLLMFGNLAITATVLAAQGLINRRRRRRAERDLTPRWQLHREVTVIATTRRLLIPAADGRWLSFWYEDIAEYHPNLQHRTLVLTFGDECDPLRLHGPAVPALALWTANGLYGNDWITDSRLDVLR